MPSSSNLCLGDLGWGGVWVDLLSVLVVSHTWGRSTVASSFAGTDTNDLSVDSARNAVLELQVHLWDWVLVEDGGISQITDGSDFDHVADGESLDGLILWCASRAVGAADWLDVTTALLVATVGCSLLDHFVGLVIFCLEG